MSSEGSERRSGERRAREDFIGCHVDGCGDPPAHIYHDDDTGVRGIQRCRKHSPPYPGRPFVWRGSDRRHSREDPERSEGGAGSGRLSEGVRCSNPRCESWGCENPAHRPVGGRYRKRPVVIDARPWWKSGDHPAVTPWPIREAEHCPKCDRPWMDHGAITTLETAPGAAHSVCPGDWIITGVQGESYACKPDIFAATYEPADAPPTNSQSEPATAPDTPSEEPLADIEWLLHRQLADLPSDCDVSWLDEAIGKITRLRAPTREGDET